MVFAMVGFPGLYIVLYFRFLSPYFTKDETRNESAKNGENTKERKTKDEISLIPAQHTFLQFKIEITHTPL